LNSGFASAVYRYPNERLSIILMSNVENSAPHLARIAHDLAAISFGEKYEFPQTRVETKIDPTRIDRFLGQYEFGPGRMITVTREGDKLFAQRGSEPAFEMFAESDTKYFLKIGDVRFEFVIESSGAVSGLVLRANGQEMQGKKVK